MRIHGLLVVRDEADIIAQCLRHAATWCDHIYVYDTGSTDGSWEIVQELATELKQVVPYKREEVWFDDGLRAVIFDHYRSKARDGDWFVRLDSDEFYPVPPSQFIREHLRPIESLIYYQAYEFRLTWEEVENYSSDASILADRKSPIQDRRRYFIPLVYSEPRLFRYRTGMSWLPTRPWPFNCGFAARERIPVQHYQHRDPIQMIQRFHLRNIMRRKMRIVNPAAIAHWDLTDWRSEVLKSSDERLVFWRHGSPLPPFHLSGHLAPVGRRALQWALYRSCVRAIDATRPTFPLQYTPAPLPMDTTRELKNVPLRMCDAAHFSGH
jgi:hypothetical protein